MATRESHRMPERRYGAPQISGPMIIAALGAAFLLSILTYSMMNAPSGDGMARINSGPGINAPAANTGSNMTSTTGTGSLNEPGPALAPSRAPAPTAPPR